MGIAQTRTISFSHWYSQKQLFLFFLVFFCVVSVISLWIPPLQSPDEPNHLKRAYLLSKGEIFLKTRDGVTGGEVDKGLLEFENSFSYLRISPQVPMARVNFSKLEDSKKIFWQGTHVFSALPNTAIYFPISYIPQAIGLSVGQTFDLSIYQSYMLCRILSLFLALTIIYLSTIFYPIPPLALASLMVPMSLFQFGSASLDPISYALCFLIAAIYLRVCTVNSQLSSWLLAIFGLSILAFITTRINFVPLALIPLAIYWRHKQKSGLFLTSALFILAIAWSLYGLITVKGVQVGRSLTTIEIIQYYLNEPLRFIEVLLNTFSKWGLMRQYWEQFVGKLGWLDTKIIDLGGVTYVIYFLVFVYIAYLTNTPFTLLKKNYHRLFYDAILLLSWFALFAILLFVWTKHPANTVDGIQGRYFTPFVILAAYANFDQTSDAKGIQKVRFAMAFLFFISIPITLLALQNRYWS